jgi:hypothetical protein
MNLLYREKTEETILEFPIIKEDIENISQEMSKLKLDEYLDAESVILDKDVIFKRIVFLKCKSRYHSISIMQKRMLMH